MTKNHIPDNQKKNNFSVPLTTIITTVVALSAQSIRAESDVTGEKVIDILREEPIETSMFTKDLSALMTATLIAEGDEEEGEKTAEFSSATDDGSSSEQDSQSATSQSKAKDGSQDGGEVIEKTGSDSAEQNQQGLQLDSEQAEGSEFQEYSQDAKANTTQVSSAVDHSSSYQFNYDAQRIDLSSNGDLTKVSIEPKDASSDGSASEARFSQPTSTLAEQAQQTETADTSLTETADAVNQAPRAVSFANVINLSNITDTNERVKVSDIIITDGDGGINELSLTGADADKFEIDGTGLYLSAGTQLIGGSSLMVTVEVDDSSVGNTPDASETLMLPIELLAPVITNQGNYTTAEEVLSTIVDIDALDGNDSENNGLAYSLGGDDAANFTINTSGELSFASAPNFEVPSDVDINNIYEVDVTVTDSDGLTDTLLLEVEVTDVNEAPEINEILLGQLNQQNFVVPETIFISIDVNATDDSDSEGDGLTYSFSGDMSVVGAIPDQGKLFFNLLDFEFPMDGNSDNVYEYEVTVTDSGGLTDTASFTIEVTDVDGF